MAGQFPGEPHGKVPGKHSVHPPAPATKPKSRRQIWPPSPTPVDRLGPWGPSQAGQCLDNLLAPPGCACLELPANSCLPSGRLGGPLWRGGCGGRKSPPPPDPQATDTSPRAGLILSGHPLCVLQLTLQLEPCPRGHQLRGPPVALRGSGLSQLFSAP